MGLGLFKYSLADGPDNGAGPAALAAAIGFVKACAR